MDLLRLVLARQPLSRFTELPRLLQSPAFIRTRISRVNPRGFGRLAGDTEVTDYFRLCTLQGELTPVGWRFLTLEDLRARAVFLRSPVMYEIFRDTVCLSDVGFWTAIKSGIPEIQAAALASSDRRRLEEFSADCPSIPWTSGLVREISKIARLGPWSRMMGFLDIPPLNHSSYPYCLGKIEAILMGVETKQRNQAIENFFWKLGFTDLMKIAYLKMESGYLYGLDQLINDDNFLDIFSDAISEVSVEGMKLILRRYGTQRVTSNIYYVCTELKYQRRARAAVEDQWLMENLPSLAGTAIRILAGEIMDEPLSLELRYEIGSAGPIDRVRNPYFISRRQEQLDEFSIFDPVWSSTHNESLSLKKEVCDSIACVYGRGDLINPDLLMLNIKDNPDGQAGVSTDGKVAYMSREDIQRRLSPEILASLGIPELPEVIAARQQHRDQILAELLKPCFSSF